MFTYLLRLFFQELCVDCVMHPGQLPDEAYLSIIKQCTNNPATFPDAKPSLASDCLKRAIRLLAYCLTVFPPTKEFAPYLAWWCRQEPCKSLGAQYNVNGLLARICLSGAVQPSLIPRQEHFDAEGRVTYTRHWIGRSWNGDGLSEIMDPRLKLGAFKAVEYNSRNASWHVLKRARRPSDAAAAVLDDVEHHWEPGTRGGGGGGGGGGGASKSKSKPRRKKVEKPSPFARIGGGESKSNGPRRAAPPPPRR